MRRNHRKAIVKAIWIPFLIAIFYLFSGIGRSVENDVVRKSSNRDKVKKLPDPIGDKSSSDGFTGADMEWAIVKPMADVVTNVSTRSVKNEIRKDDKIFQEIIDQDNQDEDQIDTNNFEDNNDDKTIIVPSIQLSPTRRNEANWFLSNSLKSWLSRELDTCLGSMLFILTTDHISVARRDLELVLRSGEEKNHDLSVIWNSGMFDRGVVRSLDYNYSVIDSIISGDISSLNHDTIHKENINIGDSRPNKSYLPRVGADVVSGVVLGEIKYSFMQYLACFRDKSNLNLDEVGGVDEAVDINKPSRWKSHDMRFRKRRARTVPMASDSVDTDLCRPNVVKAEINSVYFAHPLANSRIMATVSNLAASSTGLTFSPDSANNYGITFTLILSDPWTRFLDEMIVISGNLSSHDFQTYLSNNIASELNHLEQCIGLEQSIVDCEVADQVSTKELSNNIRNKYHLSKSLYSYWLEMWLDSTTSAAAATTTATENNQETTRNIKRNSLTYLRILVKEALVGDAENTSTKKINLNDLVSLQVSTPVNRKISSPSLNQQDPNTPNLEDQDQAYENLYALIPGDLLQRIQKLIQNDRERLQQVMVRYKRNREWNMMSSHW